MGRILIDGFPRSGNTFFYELLSNSFSDVDIPQFKHSVKTFSPNTYVLLRNPKYSISSFMSTFRHDDPKSAEDWWVRYYLTAIDEKVKFISFDDLINDPIKIVDKISLDLGLTYKIKDLDSLNKNESKIPYEKIYDFDRANPIYFSLLESLW